MTDFQLRPITEDEYPSFARCFARAFAHDRDETEEKLERELFELPRTLAAFDDRAGLVGTTLSYARELSIPGGVVPAAHVSGVSVYGTHRRRGIMTRLMTRQLTDLAGAGAEPVALLWPSEEPIYGRFGYGPATTGVSYDADTRGLSVAADPGDGQLREVDFTGSGETLAGIYDAVRANHPGRSSRSAAQWRMMGADLVSWRGGATSVRAVIHEPADGGAPDGYATFRISRGSDADGRLLTVGVEDVIAANLPAYRQLWGYLLSVDLTRRVRFNFGAVDEPLRYLVDAYAKLNPRELRGLWLRVVDLPGALRARSYAAPVDVVLEVTDPLLPGNAGRWRLSADVANATGVTCEPTGDPADLRLDVAALGAAYLGGTPLAALGHAGQVVEVRPGALAAASAAFGWHRAPTGIEIF